MKAKLLFSTALGLGIWSLSHVAAANYWFDGPCSAAEIMAPSPCIEVRIGSVFYHYNGGEYDEHDPGNPHVGHDNWHGHPDPNIGDFVFAGDNVLLGCDITLDCTLELTGQVKKCQDSNGDWRIGIKVTGGNVSNGLFCGTVALSGFPWFSKEPTITPHCPFTDDCDNFIPYVQNASSYTGNFGAVSVSALGIPQVTNEHLHGVVYNMPGSFDFTNKTFYDCNNPENPGCSLDGILTLQNADELNIY